MIYNLIGILAIIGGGIVFVLRNRIIKFRVNLYQKLNKNLDEKKLRKLKQLINSQQYLGLSF